MGKKSEYVYTKIPTRFWMGGMRRLSFQAKYLMLYFLTNHHRNLVGFYSLPIGYALADTGFEADEFEQAFAELKEKGSVLYDDESEVILIPKYLEYNPLENENQKVSAIKKINELPDTYLMGRFLECLEAAGIAGSLFEAVATLSKDSQPLPEGLGKPLPKGLPKPLSKGLPKPLPQPLPEGLGKPVAVAVTGIETSNRVGGYVDNAKHDKPENQSSQGKATQKPDVDNTSTYPHDKKRAKPGKEVLREVQKILLSRDQLSEPNLEACLSIVDLWGSDEGLKRIRGLLTDFDHPENDIPFTALLESTVEWGQRVEMQGAPDAKQRAPT